MTTTKIENPNVGDCICVYLDHGWIQITFEPEGVGIDAFDHNDDLFTTEYIVAGDLGPEGELE